MIFNNDVCVLLSIQRYNIVFLSIFYKIFEIPLGPWTIHDVGILFAGPFHSTVIAPAHPGTHDFMSDL